MLNWNLLERMGYATISGTNGEEGLEKAIAAKPDLILIDMMMPVMDGWEATLRANHKTKAISILASTALFRSSHLHACLEAGCNDYILKPFSFLELQRKIQALLVGTALRPLAI